eukprot:140117-Prorocentrum_minimum.AAC.1
MYTQHQFGTQADIIYPPPPCVWFVGALLAATPRQLSADARVATIPCDARHRDRWRALALWPKLGPHVANEVQARQELNAEHAADRAAQDNVDWLLHMDADELFYCPEGTCSRTSPTHPLH